MKKNAKSESYFPQCAALRARAGYAQWLTRAGPRRRCFQPQELSLWGSAWSTRTGRFEWRRTQRSCGSAAWARRQTRRCCSSLVRDTAETRLREHPGSLPSRRRGHQSGFRRQRQRAGCRAGGAGRVPDERSGGGVGCQARDRPGARSLLPKRRPQRLSRSGRRVFCVTDAAFQLRRLPGWGAGGEGAGGTSENGVPGPGGAPAAGGAGGGGGGGGGAGEGAGRESAQRRGGVRRDAQRGALRLWPARAQARPAAQGGRGAARPQGRRRPRGGEGPGGERPAQPARPPPLTNATDRWSSPAGWARRR